MLSIKSRDFCVKADTSFMLLMKEQQKSQRKNIKMMENECMQNE